MRRGKSFSVSGSGGGGASRLCSVGGVLISETPLLPAPPFLSYSHTTAAPPPEPMFTNVSLTKSLVQKRSPGHCVHYHVNFSPFNRLSTILTCLNYRLNHSSISPVIQVIQYNKISIFFFPSLLNKTT